jgi:pilus assembly protein CpaE
MLTAAIASSDSTTAAQLLVSLQQTGLVTSVKSWTLPADRLDANDSIPDVVLLDLGRDPEPHFAFGAHVRQLRPAVRLIACSAVNPPSQQMLLDAMRSGVQDFVFKPVAPEALREVFTRFHQEGHTAEQRSAQKLIVLMGAKGGVGTTTVAVNLGVQLATFAHKRVVLLDLARPLGNAHLLLDLNPRFGIRDAIENIDRLDTHFFDGLVTAHKTKLHILAGTLHAEGWQSIPATLLDRVANVAQTNFDMVLADVGSQFGSDWTAILRTSRMILLVTETNVPSLWALERRLSALEGLGIESEKVRVVVNRWHKGDQETLNSVQKNIKRPIIVSLPNDFRKANTSINLGTPLMDNHNNNLTNHYRQLASLLTGMDAFSAQKQGSIGKFFSFPAKGGT